VYCDVGNTGQVARAVEKRFARRVTQAAWRLEDAVSEEDDCSMGEALEEALLWEEAMSPCDGELGDWKLWLASKEGDRDESSRCE
jgi:hypothetical protein